MLRSIFSYLSNAKIQFFSITLQIAKNRSKQATTLIFFPEKAESPYFTNLEKGGQKGGQEKVYFSLKLLVKMKKIEFELEFQTKIGSPLAPLLAPLFQIRKVWTLSYLWKKN